MEISKNAHSFYIIWYFLQIQKSQEFCRRLIHSLQACWFLSLFSCFYRPRSFTKQTWTSSKRTILHQVGQFFLTAFHHTSNMSFPVYGWLSCCTALSAGSRLQTWSRSRAASEDRADLSEQSAALLAGAGLVPHAVNTARRKSRRPTCSEGATCCQLVVKNHKQSGKCLNICIPILHKIILSTCLCVCLSVCPSVLLSLCPSFILLFISGSNYNTVAGFSFTQLPAVTSCHQLDLERYFMLYY